MTINESHAWWSRLRHQGLLLSPVVMLERYPDVPLSAAFHQTSKLRDAFTRFSSSTDADSERATLAWVDALLENYLGHKEGRLARQHKIPEKLHAVVRIGTRTETICPHRVVFADAEGKTPALLVMIDASPHVGRGRGRTAYARFLELLRGTGHRLGLLTNGRQFRLVYAGLDFESWCEWESDRWFDDGDGGEELAGLRLLLSPDSLKPIREGVSGLLDAVEESRKRQADLSSVLRENVRKAVEILLEEVSSANRTAPNLFASLVAAGSERPLSDAEAHEALLQATVRVVMRLVVCLFAESRQLLPVNDSVYAPSYGVRSLYEMLEDASRNEGGTHGLMNRQTAWPRLMALFRLIHDGSSHGQFPLRAYGGALFRPGRADSDDPVVRALHILEHSVTVGDATVYHVLRKLLRGPLPVIRGRAKTFVEGPVDYTDLRTEFIGLIYEGLLDYKLKRTDEKIGPQVFLNIGREPVLPLSRLEEMLEKDRNGLKDLLTKLRKEKTTGQEDDDEEAEGQEDDLDAQESEADEADARTEVETEPLEEPEVLHGEDHLDAVSAAKRWGKEAVVLAGLVGTQRGNEPDTEYQVRVEAEANRLIKRVVATGEFYLVRAGNNRKGTGTFYTRPQLAVPTVHRTLEPLCYDNSEDGTLTPKSPETILGLKVCDPACGSASFLVGSLHYLTEALYRSLCHHRKLDDPAEAKKLTLPYGRPRTGRADEELVPFPPDDPQRGDTFPDRIKALLRRHVVERAVYGVDINPLAVEFARVSLWVETLDPELPFSFLDHKVKVGNSLVGCWLDGVLDYPLRAWEREGGDGKTGPRTLRIESLLKGSKVGDRRSGDGVVKQEMRALIDGRFRGQKNLFSDDKTTTEQVVTDARRDYERLHDLPGYEPEEREEYYRHHVENSPAVRQLKAAMNEWCAVWFWPADEESLNHVPTPGNFHSYETPETTGIVRRLTSEVRFFHWEVEFPDVFTRDRCGFDAMIGNPPWNVMKPNSHEFFTDYDPLYRTYSKEAAKEKQSELFASLPAMRDAWDSYKAHFKSLSNWVKAASEPFKLALARGKKGEGLASAWERERAKRVGFADNEHPFMDQGSADLNSYKLFLEVAYRLLTPTGRMGFIVPSGLYTDAGTQKLRTRFLDHSTWDWLFSFENKYEIFSIHRSFKFAAVIVDRRKSNAPLHAAFMVHALADWERANPPVFPFDRSLIPLFSPRSKSLPEVRTSRDLAVCLTIYTDSVRLGDEVPDWEAVYSREFDMTNDSKHFPALEKWKAKGYTPDVFGRWVGPGKEIALPLYEGRMIGQFDFSQKGWVRGKGRQAVWRPLPDDHKTLEPQYLVSADTYAGWPDVPHGTKLAFMDVTSATNSRTFIASVLPDMPCGNKVPTLSFKTGDIDRPLLLSTVCNSLSFDFATRNRLGGITLNWFIVEELPIPASIPESTATRLATNAAHLTFLHRRFAPEWLRLKHLYPDLATKPWKHWWAVTEADRLRLRVEIDAWCADLYELNTEDFDWVVKECQLPVDQLRDRQVRSRLDPKGFWRIDKELDPRERLTNLAASAFRALKAGKWTAKTAAAMSNDEFFALIGIPEMTAGPEPLIRKRGGCHRWKPEEFGPDDPRHGWTWDHCWADAVTLLGTEDAVRKLVERQRPEKKGESADGSTGLGQSLEPKQGRLF